ncbi:hypothetical protein Tco_0860309 [Tanacetum coccineum]|uniref:Uncharacterized protein n=1 Tax=Tanacetum coccineum TaxID=301880 RepID=A0ABQ5BHK8_9ASTR
MWDITIEDVERIRKFFNVPDEIDKIVQPVIHEPIHTTPPNDDYVAPATKSILDELLEEFSDVILNVTMVGDEADFNPTKDLEELERLLAKEPHSNFTEIQGHSVIINTEPFIHTQLISPLCGVFKTSKPCKGFSFITSPHPHTLHLLPPQQYFGAAPPLPAGFQPPQRRTPPSQPGTPSPPLHATLITIVITSNPTPSPPRLPHLHRRIHLITTTSSPPSAPHPPRHHHVHPITIFTSTMPLPWHTSPPAAILAAQPLSPPRQPPRRHVTATETTTTFIS